MSVRSLFHQPMDEKIKTWPLRFPAKETLIWRRHCSIDQSCCSMTSKQFLESSLLMKFVYPSVRLANQKPGAFVSVRYTNQIARSISVRLLFLFCSRVFISRSYENRSIRYVKAYLCKIPSSICNNDYSHVSSKQKGNNKWFSMHMHLELSCSYRYDL